METSDSLQYLTPITKLLIPYYERRYKIKLSSNLISHSEKISQLKQKIKKRIKAQTSEVEFARFVQKAFSYPFFNYCYPECWDDIYQALEKENMAHEYLLKDSSAAYIKKDLTVEDLQRFYSIIPKKIRKDRQLQALFMVSTAPRKAKMIEFNFLYDDSSLDVLFDNSEYTNRLEAAALERDLKALSCSNETAGYLFYSYILNTESDINHNELFLVSDGKACIPVYYEDFTDHFPSSYYKIPILFNNNILSPMHRGAQECNLLNILYAKTLLKNDAQFLKGSIFFEKYNSTGEIERFFVPHPEVLKYSHSEQYNKYILSLTSDGKYVHNGKESENPSLEEMLSESIKNIEKLQIVNPDAVTEAIKKILEDNKMLLKKLPSIDEDFKKHYENIVLPCRRKIGRGGLSEWDVVKRKKLREKLPEYKAAYGKKNELSRNIVHLFRFRGLKILELVGPEITALPALFELEKLTLHHCDKIEDFSILSTFTKLEELECINIKITDISFIPAQNLKKLTLEYCEQIENCDHLAKLERLEWLRLYNIPIKELPKLPSSIKHFELSSCSGIINLNFLQDLPGLEVLKLRSMTVTDLSLLPLGIRELDLFCSEIEDFTYLANCKELEKLNLEYTNIEDLSVLPTSIKKLEIHTCENIKFCPEWLKEGVRSKDIEVTGDDGGFILKLANIEITDLYLIQPEVKELNLRFCSKIKDFTPLANFKGLEWLDLSNTNIEDLSVLPTSIKRLKIFKCENIKCCPEWLKEGVKSGNIRVTDGNWNSNDTKTNNAAMRKLLALPTSLPVNPELLPTLLGHNSAERIPTVLTQPEIMNSTENLLKA